jgi:hypothetical protein
MCANLLWFDVFQTFPHHFQYCRKLNALEAHASQAPSLAQVEGNGKFDLTRAYNLAVRHSHGSRIMELDSDNKILPDFVKMHPQVAGVFYAENWESARSENERHLNGVYFVDRATWARANGFDERIIGYGHDNDNLHMQLSLVSKALFF